MTINALSLITAQSNRKPYKFDIPNSLRFDDDEYSRLTKIFSTAQTDTTKWTVSFWYKNAASDDMSDVYFFQSNSGTDSGFNYGEIGVSYGPNNVGIWNEYNENNPWSLNNGNKFRDINWYHFVYSYDESETNAIDRLKQYINGVRSTVTASLGSGPSSSYQCDWCKQNYYTAIGKAYDGLQHPSHSAYPFRGYMAEFHSFDGIVLEPSDFGRTDKYGNWVPKKVTNTNYGNNGFYLDFSDATDIGADRSGNNNHFTPSGFNTSGNFDNDYSLDSPTNNYATWDTLTPYVTTSHGGLNITNQRNCITTFGKFKTGKYYFEWNATQGGYIGVTDNIDSWGDDTTPFAHSDDSLGYYAANQKVYRNSSTGVTYGSSPIQSGVLAMAVDFDNGSIEYFHNGSSIGYATTVTSALTSGKEYYIAGQGLDTTNDIKTNFGQQPFVYTPPTGFIGLHKKTLPAKKFIDGTDHFRTILGSDFKKGPITDKEVISGANWTYTDLFIHNTPYGGIIPENLLLDTSLNNLNSGSSTVSAHIGLFSAVVEHRYEFEFDPPIPSSLIQWRRHGGLGFSDGDAIVTKADDSTVNITASEVPISPYTGTTSTNYDIKKVFIRNRSTEGAATTANYVFFSITDTNGNKKIFYNERFKLKFNNSNNFNLFPVRSIVSTSQDATARGIVTEVDTANNTITVGVTTGNFNVGDDLALFKSQIISASQETFPSGLWWIKDRENSNQHQLVDSVRGNTIASQTPSSTKNTTYVPPTGNSVAWCWNSANPELSGFNIIEYTGDANATQAIAHGLPGTPEFIITGSQGATPGGYETFHVGCTPGKSLTIDSPAAEQTDTRYSGVDATNITYGSDYNTNGQLMIAYAWTSIPGYSAFGSYTGNGSADGPFVYTGFKPAFVMYKNKGATSWVIQDSTRSPYNPSVDLLYPDFTQDEFIGGSTYALDLLSNGFKWKSNPATGNANGSTYIYAAFAEKPSFAKNFSSANPR